MKKFESQTYYEILDIPVQATPFEIRQAYKSALAIYNEDSLATYSFFSELERQEVLKRIEEAFLILTDQDKRADYDRQLIHDGKIAAAAVEKKEKKKAVPLFQTKNVVEKNALFKRIQDRIRETDVKGIAEGMLSKDLISGSDLRNLRESVGIGIEEIYEVTRITASTLKAIEQDEYDKLPTAIYLKNFLKSYAEILQVDSEKIIAGYMKNLSQNTPS
ncbi:MAG TPA: DnaJ domain-containing protein [Deltaproteobacteria bacterium]|nr:DnaJ domain-containing protein [Deltaproteobacteria bacterium]